MVNSAFWDTFISKGRGKVYPGWGRYTYYWLVEKGKTRMIVTS